MCGIVAYKGPELDAGKIVYDGLKLLEYRGYDSSGIAVFNNNKIEIFKKKGKVKYSEEIFKKSEIRTDIAIGHTRWATHGEPSDINSHPIISYHKKLTIVHNGIIENYKELRLILEEEKYKFNTETDTEVFVNFIELCVSKSETFEQGFSYALSKVTGAFGIVLLVNNDPSILYAARKGSPLAIGKFNENFIIASDASPIIEYTNKIIYLENDTFLKIKEDNFKIYDFDLKSVKKTFNEVDIELQGIQNIRLIQ